MLIIAGDDPAAHFFVRSAIVWMNDFVVLVLIFGNLIYSVHNTPTVGQTTGRDKEQVSEAIRTIAHRRASGSGAARILSLQRNSNSNRPEANLDSDLESCPVIKTAAGSGTPTTKASSSAGKEHLISELTLSRFSEASGRDESTIVVPSSQSVRSGDSALRWEKSMEEKQPRSPHHGPTIPERGETIYETEVTMSECEDTNKVLESRPQEQAQHTSPHLPPVPVRGETTFEKESELTLSGFFEAPNNDGSIEC